MGIQQIITGLGKTADPQKVLSTNRKKVSEEETGKVEETTSKDKIDLSEEGMKLDQMFKELERTRAGIKEDPKNAVKAQANLSGFNALEVLDESFSSVYASLDQVKESITGNAKLALDSQSNLVRKSVLETITSN